MWSRSQSRASIRQPGNTQCRSRRMTCSRITGGGSWASQARSALRSSTGRTVNPTNPPALADPAELAELAGPAGSAGAEPPRAAAPPTPVLVPLVPWSQVASRSRVIGPSFSIQAPPVPVARSAADTCTYKVARGRVGRQPVPPDRAVGADSSAPRATFPVAAAASAAPSPSLPLSPSLAVSGSGGVSGVGAGGGRG